MCTTQPFVLEAHPTTATLYLCRRVSVSALIEALAHCECLPNGVSVLRVDGRGAEPMDDAARATLLHGLRRWRGGRGGHTLGHAA